MVNNIKYMLAAIVLAGATFVAGRLTAPKPAAQVIVDTKKDTNKVKDTKKTTTKTKLPDGTTTTVTVVDSHTDTKTTEVLHQETKVEILPRYKFGLTWGHDENKKAVRGVLLGMQIYGNFDVGLYATEKKDYGAYIMMGF